MPRRQGIRGTMRMLPPDLTQFPMVATQSSALTCGAMVECVLRLQALVSSSQ